MLFECYIKVLALLSRCVFGDNPMFSNPLLCTGKKGCRKIYPTQGETKVPFYLFSIVNLVKGSQLLSDFDVDTSLDYGMHIEGLIKKIHKDDEAKKHGTENQ